ncbi:MAG TPA: hypothetical protein VHU41_18490 [Thermoanaerobaculia bacterium]|jgi:hypothetical protein|nr:hypothetical protein [Thermoanaerobaculia bacterium]
MKHAARTALALFASLLLAGAAIAGPVSTDYFTVNLPDAYAAPVMSTATQNGITTSTWIAKAPTGEAVVISVSTMPGKIEDPAKLIDSTRDSLLKSVKGTLDSEQPLTGPLPGRDLLFKSGTAFLHSRLIVSGDRLYQLLYVGRTQAERDAPAVAQMFDSFTVKTTTLTSTTSSTTSTTTTTTTTAPAPVPPPK